MLQLLEDVFVDEIAAVGLGERVGRQPVLVTAP